MKPQFLIAAPSSDSGKTILTLGILRWLKNKGYRVQPFKCGPDYIDTKHHAVAAAIPSINLDTFMMATSHVKEVYAKYTAQADVSVVEGVMGLFDGATKMQNSSAEIGILLQLPVILIVNAKAVAYSAAALIYGFKNFNPEVKIVGVIFNLVNTESHYHFLKDACTDVGVEALGYIPFNAALDIPSRHLGLLMPEEINYDTIIQQAADHISKTVNIKRLLEISNSPSNLPEAKKEDPNSPSKLTIAIAKDEAFNFIYHENIILFKQLGKVVYFSPMRDHELPAADVVYLAGGYPELYLNELSSNTAMQRALLNFCENGGKVIAECGGMMYLGKAIINKAGNRYGMVGFLDIETSMEKAKLVLGYRSVIIDGVTLKGHEFHYSSCTEKKVMTSKAEVFSARGLKVNTPIYHKKNVIASYIHFYWAEQRNIMDRLFLENETFKSNAK